MILGSLIVTYYINDTSPTTISYQTVTEDDIDTILAEFEDARNQNDGKVFSGWQVAIGNRATENDIKDAINSGGTINLYGYYNEEGGGG